MGFWRSALRLDVPNVGAVEATARTIAAAGPRFATSIDPGTLYGYATLDEAIRVLGAGGDVTRDVAIRVPSVKKARDLTCGGLGQIPLNLHGPSGAVEPWSLFEQPEEGRAPSLTWTDVLDDMLFRKYARLEVTHYGWHGKPAQVKRMEPGQYSKGKGGYWVNRPGEPAKWVPDAHVIVIESPNDALLVAGARAIRVLARLEVGALNAVDGIPPMDYFTPEGDVDPFETDEDVVAFLDSHAAARQARSTAYYPAGIKYNSNAFSPKDLQLVEAREMAIGEIARVTGVDPEDLGVPTTSRTYFNAQDRRRHLLDFLHGPNRVALAGRLTMPDVTPRGYTVRFDTSDFARADDLTTAQTDEVLVRSGVMTINEVRARRGLPPIDGGDQPATTPAPVTAPSEETADV